jgi:integrase
MAVYLSLSRLLAELSPERRPVAELWKALRVERKEFTAWLAAHRDDLAEAGVQLHVATHSQARALTLHIELPDGVRYAALSRPQVEAPKPAPRARTRKAAPSPLQAVEQLAPPAPPAAPPPAALAVVEPAPIVPIGTLAQAGQAADRAAAHGAFVRYRAAKAAETLRAQDSDLDRWAAYLAAAGVAGASCSWAEDPACWAGCSWGLVEGFLAWQGQEGYSLASMSRSLSTVRAYAKLAARAGALPVEQLRLIETIETPAPRSKEGRNADAKRPTTRRPEKAKKAEPVRITEAQAKALKRQHEDTPQGRRDALLMCLLLDHGLRVSELADLKVTDLDLKARRIEFYRRKVHRSGAQDLSRDTLAAARHYFDAGDAPAAGLVLRAGAEGLPGQRGELGGPGMSTRRIAGRVTILGRAQGLEGLSPHDCRHYWATEAARAGTDLFTLQEAGGWASLDMPRRYVEAGGVANVRRRDAEDAEDAVEGTDDER